MAYHSLGFGMAVSWLWLSFLNGPLLENSVTSTAPMREELFVLFMFVHACTYFILSKSDRLACSFPEKSTVYCAGSGMAISIILLTLNNSMLLYGAAVLGGAADALFMAFWLKSFTAMPLNKAGLSFGVGTVMAAAVTIAGYLFLTHSIQLMIAGIALPLFSAGLYCHFQPVIDNNSAQQLSQLASHAYSPRFLLRVVLFYLAGAQIYKLTIMDNAFLTSFWLSNITYSAVCLSAGVMMYRNQYIRVSTLFRPVLPLMAIGFFVVPLTMDKIPLVPFLLLQAGVAFFDMYTWFYVIRASGSFVKPLPVIGQGMAVITGSILLGETVFNFALDFFALLSYINMIVLFGGILSLYAAFLFKADDEVFAALATASAIPADGQDFILNKGENDFYQQLATQYQLTPRETEILEMLAKGRNGTYIREKLHITENTVKFHIRNIYGKMAVSNRQELLNLLDGRKKPQ